MKLFNCTALGGYFNYKGLCFFFSSSDSSTTTTMWCANYIKKSTKSKKRARFRQSKLSSYTHSKMKFFIEYLLNWLRFDKFTYRHRHFFCVNIWWRKKEDNLSRSFKLWFYCMKPMSVLELLLRELKLIG